ncbi:MAG: GIY-YIG nuclease family protein [Bacillota bacterium]|jgi:hypothetical protein
MDRKKELKEQYRQMKPDMGIFIIRFNAGNKCFIEGTQDMKSRINRYKFQLEFGSHPCRELQKDWNSQGPGSFSFEVLENLPYDKDESKTDYSDDLALLQMIWKEKLAKEGWKVY